MKSGERRFAERIEQKLENDYLAWYDVPVGGQVRHPDFIIFNPRRGLIVLEVKDWGIESILQGSNKDQFRVQMPGGEAWLRNPFEQARLDVLTIVNLLQADPLLVAKEGPYAGKLSFPWSYGVVLPNITRRQFTDGNLGEVIPRNRVICKDEMTESVSHEDFQRRIWEMFPFVPKVPLGLPEIDRIRARIFPELRIRGTQLNLFDEPNPDAAMPDLIRVMDMQQEQLARSLGDGHRVIHGVAGSGKTMILGFRCVELAKRGRPVLVLCFNRTLASWLEGMLREKNLHSSVTVRNFHAWCRDQLVAFHAGLPADGLDGGAYSEQLVQRVIAATDRGIIPRAQYGAVLIDEGHDFQPEWLKLVVQMVDPSENSLLLLYDDAQSIYERPKFTFKSVGVQAQGRTTILRLNYRSTAEILKFAYDFAKEVLAPSEADDDAIPLIRPESAGRHGRPPVLVKLPSLQAELDHIIDRYRELHEDGIAWKNMALVYRTGAIGAQAKQRLEAERIPCFWMGKGANKNSYVPNEDSVKLLTMHSSKGLEFPVVAVPAVQKPDSGDQKAKEEMRLLYVAMTRAMEELVVTGPAR